MKLYYMPNACSLAPHIALEWAGADYEGVRLDHDQVHGEDYLKLNPKGAVPTLVTDDGRVLTEALAVLLYIADRFPQADLGAAGDDAFARARLNEALSELVSNLHPAFRPLFAPQRFVTEEAAEDQVKQAAYGLIDRAFDRLEHRMDGRDWMLDRRSVADPYLYVLTRWKGMTPRKIGAYPNLARFKARMAEDEGVRQALEEEGIGP